AAGAGGTASAATSGTAARLRAGVVLVDLERAGAEEQGAADDPERSRGAKRRRRSRGASGRTRRGVLRPLRGRVEPVRLRPERCAFRTTLRAVVHEKRRSRGASGRVEPVRLRPERCAFRTTLRALVGAAGATHSRI